MILSKNRFPLFGIMRSTPPMPVSRMFPAVLMLGCLVPGCLALGFTAMPALAATPPVRVCLTKAEQRAAVAEQKAIPLAKAIRNRREKGHHAELVRARLCHHGDK